MKIICLIRPDPPLIYFVNRINERHRVSLAVIESPSIRRQLITELKATHTISNIVDASMDKVLKSKTFIRDYNKYFKDKWKSISDNIPTLKVEDVNSQIVYERLKKEQSDLILDHGTSIVKNHILGTAGLALNLHWGLSPYYRGTRCTSWALINGDPYNIGVTIHKLIRIVDGGDILAQKRAIIKPDDTVHSIDMQLTQLGTELIIKAIAKIKSGEQLQFKRQDYSLGLLTPKRKWSKYLKKQVQYIKRKNLIALMLKKPARKQKLPIVEL